MSRYQLNIQNGHLAVTEWPTLSFPSLQSPDNTTTRFSRMQMKPATAAVTMSSGGGGGGMTLSALRYGTSGRTYSLLLPSPKSIEPNLSSVVCFTARNQGSILFEIQAATKLKLVRRAAESTQPPSSVANAAANIKKDSVPDNEFSLAKVPNFFCKVFLDVSAVSNFCIWICLAELLEHFNPRYQTMKAF